MRLFEPKFDSPCDGDEENKESQSEVEEKMARENKEVEEAAQKKAAEEAAVLAAIMSKLEAPVSDSVTRPLNSLDLLQEKMCNDKFARTKEGPGAARFEMQGEYGERKRIKPWRTGSKSQQQPGRAGGIIAGGKGV